VEGYLVTFFTQRSRKVDGVSIARLIVEEAKELGVRGATLFSGKEGFGHDGRFHSENYFDLEDAPMQVAMAVTEQECEHLMERIEKKQLRVFYTKSRIEFGFTSER